MARRGEAWGDSESRQMLEHAIETGRGRGLPEADARAVWEAEAAHLTECGLWWLWMQVGQDRS
jgi:hypothetical protein